MNATARWPILVIGQRIVQLRRSTAHPIWQEQTYIDARSVATGTSGTRWEIRMAKESKLQSTISKWLKSNGCFVMVLSPQPGIPNGTPDVFFCKGTLYGWIEVKASPTSRFQPLQKERIAIFSKWSYAVVCYPENWLEVQQQLVLLLAKQKCYDTSTN